MKKILIITLFLGLFISCSSKENLEGKKCPFIVNLAPRKLRGIESQGMIMAAGSKEENKFSILEVSDDVEEGSVVS